VITEHGASVVSVRGLVEDGAIQDNDRVGGEDHRAGVCSGNLNSLCARQATCQRFRRFTGLHRLIDTGHGDLERRAEVRYQLPASRRRGGKDEPHDVRRRRFATHSMW
jgi:hypothetical protein